MTKVQHDSLIGNRLDEYIIDNLLGHGGMARVYRGLDTHLHRYVAIKVIDKPFRSDSDYITRFEREARAIARLEHPHIVSIYRYGEYQNTLYMVMQYIEGADLHTVLNSYRSHKEYMNADDVRQVFRQICEALDFAHTKGVIHRDIKPSNIMLDRDGRVYVTDFGLALMTEIGTKGEIFGSPHYMAPEQAISSAGVVPQSDLYSAAVILYEMFTGQRPFDASNPMDIAMLHMSEPPDKPRKWRSEVTPKLEKVILKALEKDPEKRFASGAELATEVDEVLSNKNARITQAIYRPLADHIRLEMTTNPLTPFDRAFKQASQLKSDALVHSDNEENARDQEKKRTRRSRVPLLILIIIILLAVLAVILLGNVSIS